MNQQNWEPLHTFYPAWRIRPSADDRCNRGHMVTLLGIVGAALLTLFALVMLIVFVVMAIRDACGVGRHR